MSEQAQTKAAGAEPNPALGQRLKTFSRDLPRLMKEKPGQWVLYHGDQLIVIAKTKLELYRELERRGLRFTGREFIMRCIEPEPPEIFDSPYPADL